MNIFAIIDIMGYRSSVMAGETEKVTNAIRGAVQLLSLFLKETDMKWELYSDSIFITMELKDDDDLLNFIYCMQRVSCFSFAGKYSDSLPFKGAIAVGPVIYRQECLFSKVGEVKTGVEKNVTYFIGEPVVIAYELQEKIDFFGICIDHKSNQILKEKYNVAWNRLKNESIIDDVLVPIKMGNELRNQMQCVINFCNDPTLGVMGIWFYLEPRFLCKNEKVRIKYNNTWLVASQLITNLEIKRAASNKKNSSQ